MIDPRKSALETGVYRHRKSSKKESRLTAKSQTTLLAFCQEIPSQHLVNCNIKGERKMHSGIKKKEEGAPFNLNLLHYEFKFILI